MHAELVSFLSDGLRLDGDLYLPADGAERRPAIVAACGYTGIRREHPARFARALVPRGWIVLGFDYRGNGSSEGDRGRIVPAEQMRDVCAAVEFARSVELVDPDRVGVLGWGLGGGIVIEAAATGATVAAVAACNPIGDGERALQFMHADDLRVLRAMVAEDRERRRGGRPSRQVPAFSVVTPRNGTKAYFEEARRDAAAFVQTVTLESAEALLRFRPEDAVGRIAPRPLLLVHGAENDFHSVAESRSLYARAGEPKELVELSDRGHTEWMRDDHPTFLRVVDLLDDFFRRRLGRPTPEPGPDTEWVSSPGALR